MTAGSILLETAGKCGLFGMMNRSVGPQIRGGEAAALIRLSDGPVECMSGAYDLLIAMDWKNATRFADEMPLSADGLIVASPASGDIPDVLLASGASVAEIDIAALAKAIPGGRPNMIATGIAAGLAGLSEAVLMEVIATKLAAKGEDAIAASQACVRQGLTQARQMNRPAPFAAHEKTADKRWLITGNEAVGLGAIRAGVRFAAAYPITPATDILEWLAPALGKTGGALVQAEDELASINMIIGASFGGRAAITATSGPGLALMTEALGLAAAAEVPVVVVDVMRCGPSTGIATKSEQSDLNIAVYGFHGDAPHVVVAPLSVNDCLLTTQWAVHLAEAMQVPAIILSDQALGQARILTEPLANVAFIGARKVWKETPGQEYNRYAITADGVSPMSLPGTSGGQYTADGLAHTETGVPSSNHRDQERQMAKRRDKVENFDYGTHWGEVAGKGDTVILTWGSSSAPAREALRTLKAEGIDVKLIALRQIAPFPKDALLAALKGARRILIVEQNHSGQFHQYLRANCDLPGEVRDLHRPGPQLIGADEICNIIRDWTHA